VQLVIRIILAGVFLLALFAFAATYTVRYTEAAVLTTFGQATEKDVHLTPGLRFKWPYPIQSVTKYDTRVRSTSVKFEQQQTADSKQVVVETFCDWRVSDPLKFFRTFSNAGERSEEHFRKAEGSLEAAMRSAAGIIAQYNMTDLFTTSPSGTKLPEIEVRMRDTLRNSADKTGISLSDAGIEVVRVGIMRIVLPEEVTKTVFERMKANREKIAKETESRGKAEAQAIRSKADNDAKTIEQFATALAQEIQSRGDLEAVPYVAQMNTNGDLAVFLKTMEFLKDGGFGKQTTLVLSGDTPGVPMLFPSALDNLKTGQVPEVMRRGVLGESVARKPAAANGGGK